MAKLKVTNTNGTDLFYLEISPKGIVKSHFILKPDESREIPIETQEQLEARGIRMCWIGLKEGLGSSYEKQIASQVSMP